MEVQFEIFKSTHESWEVLFAKAALFASKLGRDRVIGISHSHENTLGVVTVWYWSE